VQLILFSIPDIGENKDMGQLRRKIETTHCMDINVPQINTTLTTVSDVLLRYVHFMGLLKINIQYKLTNLILDVYFTL